MLPSVVFLLAKCKTYVWFMYVFNSVCVCVCHMYSYDKSSWKMTAEISIGNQGEVGGKRQRGK